MSDIYFYFEGFSFKSPEFHTRDSQYEGDPDGVSWNGISLASDQPHSGVNILQQVRKNVSQKGYLLIYIYLFYLKCIKYLWVSLNVFITLNELPLYSIPIKREEAIKGI